MLRKRRLRRPAFLPVHAAKNANLAFWLILPVQWRFTISKVVRCIIIFGGEVLGEKCKAIKIVWRYLLRFPWNMNI